MCCVKLKNLPSHPTPPSHITWILMFVPPEVPFPAEAGLEPQWGSIQPLLSCYPVILLFLPGYRTLHLPLLNFSFWPIPPASLGAPEWQHSPGAYWLTPAPSLELYANLMRADSTTSFGSSVKMFKWTDPTTDPCTLLLQQPGGLCLINHCPLSLITQSVFYPSSCLSIQIVTS